MHGEPVPDSKVVLFWTRHGSRVLSGFCWFTLSGGTIVYAVEISYWFASLFKHMWSTSLPKPKLVCLLGTSKSAFVSLFHGIVRRSTIE